MALPDEPVTAASPTGTRWRFGDALVALGGGLIIAVVALIIVIAATDGDEPTTAQQFGIISVAQSLGTIGIILWLNARKGTGDLGADLGLRFAPKDLVGIAAGLGLQIALVLMLYPVVEWLGIEEAPQDAVRRTQEADDPLTLIAAFVAIAVLAPFAEELLFRGVMLRSLRRRFASWPAILLSAAVFAAVHLLDPGAYLVVPALFVVGVVLGYMAERYGNLGLSIVTHTAFNFFAYLGLVFG